MRKVSGTLNGTGAALVVGCGFIPDSITLWNLEATNPVVVEWNKNMRSVEQAEGIGSVSDGTQNLYARYTVGNGIAPYVGGDVMTAASTVYLLPTEDVLGQGNLARKGSTITANVTSWTYDSTNADKSGTISGAINTTYVGEGSIIRIWDPITRTIYDSVIAAVTSSTDITLRDTVPDGTVMHIGPMYDYIGAANVGDVIPAGFKINMTSGLNASGNLIGFEACQYLK